MIDNTMTGTTATETPNAPMTFTAAPELLRDVLHEFIALLNEAQKEAKVGPGGVPVLFPIKVDGDTYRAAEAAGVVSFVSLRDTSGAMVGAAVSLVAPDPNTSVMTATTDALNVLPEARAHGGAEMLLEAVKADVVERGAGRWMLGDRLGYPSPVDLAGHGFVPVCGYYGRWIGRA